MQRSTIVAKYKAGPNACLSIVLEADAIVTEIASLQTLSHAELKQRWQDVFGASVPHNMSKRLLIHALAYDLQVQAYGGLKKPVKQMLADAIAAAHPIGKQTCPPLTLSGVASTDLEGASSVTSPLNTSHTFIQPLSSMRPPPPIVLSPGTRLMREWRGVVHVVDRTAEGFMWNGKIYGSLSAIARTITGVRWNGLAFFGLRKRKEGHVNRADSISTDAFTDNASQSNDPEHSGNLNDPASDAGQLTATACFTPPYTPSPLTDPAL